MMSASNIHFEMAEGLRRAVKTTPKKEKKVNPASIHYGPTG